MTIASFVDHDVDLHVAEVDQTFGPVPDGYRVTHKVVANLDLPVVAVAKMGSRNAGESGPGNFWNASDL